MLSALHLGEDRAHRRCRAQTAALALHKAGIVIIALNEALNAVLLHINGIYTVVPLHKVSCPH